MIYSQSFDYDQPTRDALAGINVEASDEAVGEVARVATAVQQAPVGRALPYLEELFGITLTVDDDASTEKTRMISQ